MGGWSVVVVVVALGATAATVALRQRNDAVPTSEVKASALPVEEDKPVGEPTPAPAPQPASNVMDTKPAQAGVAHRRPRAAQRARRHRRHPAKPPHPQTRIEAKPVDPPATVPEAPPAMSPLQQERKLLDAARRALRQGRYDEVLVLARRHRQRFVTPRLAEERDVLEVRALVRQGKREQAARAAATFRQRYPHSPSLPALNKIFERKP